jgi:DNA invertase Pin-like site-specific DNA recombinase
LTRSLADFAKIVETFDSKGISFVSITQQSIRRWQTYRGDEAIHTASKKTFAQVATERIATND